MMRTIHLSQKTLDNIMQVLKSVMDDKESKLRFVAKDGYKSIGDQIFNQE